MSTATQPNESLEYIRRLTRDLRAAAIHLTPDQARYMVDAYYACQKLRIHAENQARSAVRDEEPSELVLFLADNFGTMETNVRGVLLRVARGSRAGRWMLAQHGIGPVIAAGFLAHLDVTRAPTAGQFWRFAGLDPSVVWKKGQKRPWNASLKTLCWKLSDSFVKQRGSENCFYGRLYEKRKALEVHRNESGANAETAARTLTERTFRDTATREVYEAGRLPDGRVDLRARRWTSKLFLSHLHAVMHEIEYGRPAPRPYAFDHMEGHNDFIDPQGWPCD